MYLIVGTVIILYLRHTLVSLLDDDDTNSIKSTFDIQVYHLDTDGVSMSSTSNSNPGFRTYPSHLDPVNTKFVHPHGFESIDETHKKGLLHVGSWIAILDTSLNTDDPRILLLKRGPHLVTCPNTWGLVGEHAYRNEEPLDTLTRGLEEELGTKFSQHVRDYGHIQNMTEFPVYYERSYGAENEGRIDRQITYLWLVEINTDSYGDDTTETEEEKRVTSAADASLTSGSGISDSINMKTDTNSHSQINGASASANVNAFELASFSSSSETTPDHLLHLDDEVSDHVWIKVSEMEKWIREDNILIGGERKFCHSTLVSLMHLVVERLKLMGKMVRSDDNSGGGSSMGGEEDEENSGGGEIRI